MTAPLRPIAYILAATNHGTMIVNRNDQANANPEQAYGVGFQILSRSAHDPREVDLAKGLLELRHHHFGPGVFAIDGGANIGVHTIEWARLMHGWGRVLAFEAQEHVYYALAGNIAINNCWNASARWSALGESNGFIDIPEPDYLSLGSFGSLELRKRKNTEFIGQDVSYAPEDLVRTPMVNIDSLGLQRLDFLKLDVEGMEHEVLRGGRETIARCRPVILVEVAKSDKQALISFLQELGYQTFTEGLGLNMLAVHESDPTRLQLEIKDA